MIAIVKNILDKYKCKIRFHWNCDSYIEISEWDQYFILPEDGYIEAPSLGIIKGNQWKCFDINPIEEKVIGRLIPPKIIDHTKKLNEILTF